ncbi:MAG: hypothetical protein ABSE81_05275 [Candidatus Omnitrophota bacterium]|jgi:hypothetical protein
MTGTAFKRILGLSLLFHFTLFSLFSFSLKGRITNFDYTSFYFFGRLFTPGSLIIQSNFKLVKPKSSFFHTISPEPLLPAPPYYRPALASGFLTEKESLPGSFNLAAVAPKRKPPEIIFHPVLPYGFPLYFNDRQVAHVELKFSIDDTDNPSYIKIKRSISSGNLEVDLLTMRYIQRHLFIERLKFKPASWQTVKIDLSERND